MTNTPAGLRLRRILLFVAVVWSIAGAYMALEFAMREFVQVSGATWLPVDIVVPKQSRAAQRYCEAILKMDSPGMAGTALNAGDRYAAWRYGLAAGKLNGSLARGHTSSREMDLLMQESKPLAQKLGVPALAFPKQGHSANQVRDFNASLAEDPLCVAAILQSRYSDREAALYRFGAVVGFAIVFGQDSPSLRGVLAPQIRAYGTAAQIPNLFWRNFTETGADRVSLQNALDRIDVYLKGASL